MKKTYCKNYAGVEGCDDALIEELELAGIDFFRLPVKMSTEVPTCIMGEIEGTGWCFERAWTYWMAKGPGIPLEDAMILHKNYGDVVRVAGHCGCPSPLEWYKGFGCGSYHIDTIRGLKALADTIKKIMKENTK